MLDHTNSLEEMVELKSFAQMTGLPLELLKSELFKEEQQATDKLPLSRLREVVLSYLDATMLELESEDLRL